MWFGKTGDQEENTEVHIILNSYEGIDINIFLKLKEGRTRRHLFLYLPIWYNHAACVQPQLM